jgi:hypothetical protein
VLDFVDETLNAVLQAVSILIVGNLSFARFPRPDYRIDFKRREMVSKASLS